MKKVQICNVDMQRSFTDPSLNELFVPGAVEDCQRVATFVEKNIRNPKLFNFMETMDSHYRYHVGHASYWRNEHGDHPTPFTNITPQDVDSGKWFSVHGAFKESSKKYIHDLHAAGKVHTIWPYHCLIGTEGHNIDSTIEKAIAKWELENTAVSEKITKGSNFHTEHFSALRAEVPNSDPLTHLNDHVIQSIIDCDTTIIVGEALNFCVKNTLNDIINELSKYDTNFPKKLVLFRDCTSSVPIGNYKQEAEDYFKWLESKGVTVTYSDKYVM